MPPEKPKKLPHFNLEYGEGRDIKKYFRTNHIYIEVPMKA